MSTITGKEHQLLNIFSQDFDFHIPEYQRPYAWTLTESKKLFDDLYGFFREERMDNYFLGSTVLIKEENSPYADVIDGQQRLTTLSILFACIAEKLRNYDYEAYMDCRNLLLEPGQKVAGIPPRPRLNLRKMDQPFFNKYIQNIDLKELFELGSRSMETEAQHHIQENCKLLYGLLDSEFADDIQGLLKFSAFLLNQCYLVRVSTSDQSSAYRIFSVMNSRGLNLLPIDIIKSEVIGKFDASEVSTYTDKWEQLENKCGREGFNEVFTHTRSIFVKERQRTTMLEEFTEYVLKKFTPKGLIDDVIAPYAKLYVMLKEQSYESTKQADEINRMLYWLNKLSNYDWMPPAIKFFSEHSDEPEYVLWFLTKLERLSAFMLATSKDMNQRFDRYKWILAEMDSRPSHSIHDPLTSIELTSTEKRQFLQVLDGEIYKLQAVRRNYLIQRVDSFFSDGGAVYDSKIFTIEHVLPQTVEYGSEWECVWPDSKQRDLWLNRLANLIPLTRRINSSAQNFDFRKKKENISLVKTG